MLKRTENPTGWHDHNECLTTLAHGVFREALEVEKPDVAVNIESHFFNTTIEADSCVYDLDIGKELWLNTSRWTRLTREYIDADKLQVFLDGADVINEGKGRGGAATIMHFQDVKRFEQKHRWGGCLGICTYMRDTDDRPLITFSSRTTYMGYMGFMDMAIANVLCWIMELPPEEVKFRWHISSMQLHCFKSIPFIFSQPDLYDKLLDLAKIYDKKEKGLRDDTTYTWYNITRWFVGIQRAFEEHGVDMLNHEKYGPYKRIKRRWLEHEGHLTKNVPPSLTTEDLDFSKCISHYTDEVAGASSAD